MKNKKLLWACIMVVALALVCLGGCSADKDESSKAEESVVSQHPESSEEETSEESILPPPVTELDLSDKSSGELAQVLEHPELEKLNINGRGFEDLSALSQCTKLTWLDVRGNKLDAAGYEALKAALPECEISWDVPLAGTAYDCASETITLPTEGEFTYTDFENIKYLPNITELDLTKYSFTIDEMDALADSVPEVKLLFAFDYLGKQWNSGTETMDLRGTVLNDDIELRRYLRHLPSLTYLDMCGCKLDNETMGALREDFPNIKFVWKIRLGQWTLRTDSVAFSTLIGKSTEYVKLTTETIEPLKYCTDLIALDLGHHAITDISVIGTLTNLKILILADNNIQDISPIANLKELMYLEIFINYRITDLSPLAGLTNLLDLNLYYLPVMEDYSPLYSLPKLERLWMGGWYIPKNIVDEVKANVPEDCVVCSAAAVDSTGNGWRDHKRYWPMMNMFYYNRIEPKFFE